MLPIILLGAAAVAVVVSIAVYIRACCKRNASDDTAKDEAGFDKNDYNKIEKGLSGGTEESHRNDGDDAETVETDEMQKLSQGDL
mmetsp:Transcript_1641/g.2366  ORF Transcript_1641/g.2366 Transcript_1641/m.2366 type:complete len:85 (-) Transcript_1641:381-635(-)|eukprot:CAMPEP_0185735540 /NCGR_PEP_ID=MMETSP1171-20130828/25525_1 /TAXON_ID=374046 /ORGANISM="Helicotheca tamensis, Strain CCMP826" /LENGTH=84 /DNA_ID=CAMNT_0028405883 /DNA_START=195 /DNA_END=449 /DNA_ORIENTATION=-